MVSTERVMTESREGRMRTSSQPQAFLSLFPNFLIAERRLVKMIARMMTAMPASRCL